MFSAYMINNYIVNTLYPPSYYIKRALTLNFKEEVFIMGGLFGGRRDCDRDCEGIDDSLLFFFLLLVVIFCNCR